MVTIRLEADGNQRISLLPMPVGPPKGALKSEVIRLKADDFRSLVSPLGERAGELHKMFR